MSYTAYATVAEYEELFPDAAEVTDADLRTASRHIDSLTFNRIVAAGFSSLTEFQQGIVKEVCCRQAKFETENADLLDNVLSSYSINGVSMGFGGDSWNMVTAHGVAMPRDVYALLQQTGLCCRIVG
jgi:hypothetical protein